MVSVWRNVSLDGETVELQEVPNSEQTTPPPDENENTQKPCDPHTPSTLHNSSANNPPNLHSSPTENSPNERKNSPNVRNSLKTAKDTTKAPAASTKTTSRRIRADLPFPHSSRPYRIRPGSRSKLGTRAGSVDQITGVNPAGSGPGFTRSVSEPAVPDGPHPAPVEACAVLAVGTDAVDRRMVGEPRADYGSFPSTSGVNHQEAGAMDENEAYLQSRPLLQDDSWHQPGNGRLEQGHGDSSPENGYYQTSPANNAPKNDTVRVHIGVPPPPRFPKEKLKTLLALLWMFFNFILTLTSLAITHERVPETPPLPDIVLDNVPTGAWALKVSETIIIVMVNGAFLVVLLHKHRFIVFRRIFLIMGLLYMMRSVLYFVTALPKPDPNYKCEPKAGYLSFTLVVTRVLKLLGGFGLSINGQHVFCGDYIYSGHTVTLTMAYLVLTEYTPRHWWPLHWSCLLAATTGVVMVLVARGHYTVDVLIAYWVTTRLFWLYHTVVNHAVLKDSGGNNYLSRLWWFCMLRYFERNVLAPLPRHYEWPLPWPRCLLTKRPERTS